MTTPGASDVTSPSTTAHLHRHRFAREAIGAVGVAVAVATSTAGTGGPGWRQLRLTLFVVVTALAVEAAGRMHRHASGALAVVVGTVGVVVGAGIGVPHLVKAGPTVAAVSGTFALVSGLAVIGAGVALLVGRTRWWWQVTAAPTTVAVLALAVAVGAPALLATNVPPTALGDATPADRGIDADTVSVRTIDGVHLAGWYVPSRNGAAVVVRHGAGSTRSGVLEHLVVLARAGYGVLALDARGHGESDGRAMDFGWYGDLDIAAGTDFLAVQPGVDPRRIGVVGMSMGAEEALGAAATDTAIRAVVAEGATARTDADKSWLSDVYGARGWVQERIEWVQYSLTDLLTDSGKPTPLREGVDRGVPALVIAAGTMDDEVHAAEQLRAVAPDSVETWVVEGAGHTDGLEVAPREWARRVVGFLDGVLLER